MSVEKQPITIVSGLPRSGTSMMMRMLTGGGLEPLTDGIRAADDDNPVGYYEFERVKALPEDSEWLPSAEGKVVKIISALLERLPKDRPYRVVLMEREMEEVLASQAKMLQRRGEPTDRVANERMGALFTKHLERTRAWLSEEPCFKVLNVRYREIVEDPETQADRIGAFLCRGVDLKLDIEAMARAVDPKLYRQRAS